MNVGNEWITDITPKQKVNAESNFLLIQHFLLTMTGYVQVSFTFVF